MSTHRGPLPPRITAHCWARNTPHEVLGANIRIGRQDLFIAHDTIPATIARLQAIYDLNA